MVYRGRNQPQPLQRNIDPCALVHRWGWWYVVGHCHLREAVRSFQVDRIVELTLLDETFDAPADFDARAYLSSEPRIQPRFQVRLRFAPEGASAALDDRLLWDTVHEQSDGSLIVTFNVPNLEWAARVALGYKRGLPLMGKCSSCRAGGGPPECAIRACCTEKRYYTCAECDTFETCAYFDGFSHKVASIIFGTDKPGNLCKIRELGLEAFAQDRIQCGKA